MKDICPSCKNSYDEEATRCPHCGFSYAMMDAHYSENPSFEYKLESSLLADHAGVLNSKERKDCLKRLCQFSKRFPGVYFSVLFDPAHHQDEADSKGLWALNRMTYHDLPAGSHELYGVLLYIDVNKKTASLSYGEGLAPFLTQKVAFRLVSSVYPDFYQGHYLLGIKKLLDQTSNHLSYKCRVSKK